MTLSSPAPATASAPAHGLRERKKNATRDALARAARELVLAHGLDAVTVEQICDRAGVARRTFFNYYDKKEDAALGWSGPVTPPGATEELAAGGPTGRLADDLAALVAAVLASAEFDAGTARAKAELVEREPKLLARQFWWFERELGSLESALAARREATGGCEGDLAPGVGTVAVVTLLRSAFRLWELDGYSGPVGAHLPAAQAQLRAFLGAP